MVHQLGDEDRASLNRSVLATPTTPLQIRPFEEARLAGGVGAAGAGVPRR
jgi:hypothetical protein